MKKYFYTIGEVSNLLGEKPYVIRYWESEFSFLRPRKEEGRIRKYSEENIELLKRIQDMLHNQRFTIEGARQKLKEERKLGKTAKAAPIKEPELPPGDIVITLKELRSMLESMRLTCRSLRSKTT
jgi:DNA-binding transcriptional MerR regulator